MIIHASEDGYVVLDEGDQVIAGPFVTPKEALEEAEALGIEIANIEHAQEWLRPDVD